MTEIYLNAHQFSSCAPLIRLEGNNPRISEFEEAPTCDWCQRAINDEPIIHDSDLDMFFHYSCNEKDEANSKLWESL